LSLLIGGGGGGSEGTGSSSAQTASASGTSSGSIGHAVAPTPFVALNSVVLSNSVATAAAPTKQVLQSPAAWSDAGPAIHLATANVDQALRDTIVFRSRHLALGPVKPGFDEPSGDDLAKISGLI
jgi:hypothetical protein